MEQLGTVDKAVDVLFHLHRAQAPRGVTEIGRALGLPKSSAHRLLAALARRGLVERDDHSRYRPGMALVALGLGVLEREPVAVAAQPVLEGQAREVGETFFLVAARASELRVLGKAEGTGFLRAAPRVGSTVPVHATAVGKLYLAFAPTAVALPAVLERFTSRTPTGEPQLKAAVERARRRGYAESRAEWIPGLSVLAAPVFASGQRLVAAVALAAASPRLQELGSELVANRVLAAAAVIADRLEVESPASAP
jgi:DNA-binding IclR family transcriptional regulator